MEKLKLKIITMMWVLIIGVVGPDFIGTSHSTLYGAFEDLGAGARGAGMNNAFVSLADDVYTLYYNPAGLGRVDWKELGLDYNKLYLGLDDDSNLGNSFIGYVQSFKQRGTLGVGWLNFALSHYYTENTFILGYGRQVSYSAEKLPGFLRPVLGPFGRGSITAGTKLKILSKEYKSTLYTENATNLDTGQLRGGIDPVFSKGYSSKGFSLDFGFLYDISRYHSLGLVLNDINQPDMGLISKDRVYSGKKLGYAYRTNNFNMTADIISSRNDFTFCAGVEKWLRGRILALRGGLGIGSREYANLSLGGTYKYKELFQFDYSFRYPLNGISNFYGSHQLSLVLRFGVPAVKEVDLEAEVQRLNAELEKSKKAAEEFKYQAEKITTRGKEKEEALLELQRRQQQAEGRLQQVQEEIFRIKAAMETKVSKEEKKSTVINIYLRGAMTHYNKGEYEKAIKYFQKVLELEPTHLQSNQFIKEAKEKIQQKKGEVEKHYTQGLKAYHAGDLATAIVELENALKLEPENEEIRTLLERTKKEIQLKEK